MPTQPPPDPAQVEPPPGPAEPPPTPVVPPPASVEPEPAQWAPASPTWEQSTAGNRPRRGRALLVGVVGIAVVLVVGFVGLTFLGGQVAQMLSGQVVFGTTQPDDNCLIEGSGAEFPEGSSLYWAAYLTESLPSGTALVIEYTENGQATEPDAFTVSEDGTSCIAVTQSTGPMPAGEYSIRVLRDTNVLAEGSVTVQ